MVNEKLIAGAVMILLNLVVLAPIATSMVEDAVEDNFETYPYDSACADSDCTTAEEDWATSTSEKTYYAWNLTNLDEVMSGSDPTYEKVGPFLYDITTTRNIIEFNESAGTLTYDESNAFSCSADTLNPCDMEITQLNIPFQPQVVGATGTAIDGIMDLTKAGFAAGAIGNEMESFSAGQATADGLATSYGGIQMGALGAPMDAANSSAIIGNGYFSNADPEAPGFNEWFAATNQSGMGTSVDYLATGAPSASFTDLSYAFDSAMMPTGEDASLTSMQGVLLLAGHCAAFPTATYGEIMADAANGFENVGTMQRASIWQFTAMADATTPDFNTTISRDYAMCYGIGGTFSMTHGGADDDWFQDPLAVNASTRMMNYLGVDIDNTVAMNLLFGGQGTDMPTGILATNLESTSFGIAAFAGMDAATAMSTYSLDATQYAAVGAWVGGWLTSATALPMILLGGTGTMTAEQFVNVSFGAADPVNGGYLDNSINLGGAWGTALVPASEGAPSIDLDAAVSGNILYGPLGLTTATGATIFLFGELTGMTPPVDFATMAPAAPMEWNSTTVQALYGVDANAANALRTLMMSVIYGDFVPGFLVDTFGSSGPYMTMPLDNWLFGWRDPVSAFVAGDVTDPSLGWSKLETNETYFGSGGISTGPASVYVKCTGHNSDCDKGEAISEDGSNQLSWRDNAMFAATFGLITPVNLNETTGGFLTGSGDMVNAGGYGVTAVVCDGTDEVKGIPVDECTASIDATTNPITAKLIKSFTLLDATTPALPVYFGTEISMMSEDISGLIISGSSTSTFYLDTRTGLDMASAPNMSDLQPVFEIQLSSEIEDDDAEDMESAIVQNQEYMGWWTNFDNGFDYVALLLYIGGVALIIMHFVMAGKDEEKDYS